MAQAQQSKTGGFTRTAAKKALAPLAHAAVTAGTAYLTRKAMQLWREKLQPKVEQGGARAVAQETLKNVADKGLVIDAYVRVAVIGIELITIDARIVIASVDTYLRFAEAVNRLDLTQTEAAGLAELRDGGGGDGGGNGGGKAKGMLEGAKEKASDAKEGLKERVGRD